MALTANPLDTLLSDLRTISNESKKKFPPLREASEAAILKVRTLTSKNQQNIDIRQALYDDSVKILEPFIMGCEFKQNQKVVLISLNAIQRMITHQVMSINAASKLVDCLWTLMENNLEEVKVLQTATLLLSTNNIVSGPMLARTIVLCFRLYSIDNNIVTSIASATIRQLVSTVFERIETEEFSKDNHDVDDYNELKSFISGHLVNLANALRMQYAPRSLGPASADAFLLLRDLILILSDEQSLWLVGLTDVNKTFILELLEIAFVSFSDVLVRYEEFRCLVKERVCSMILELFSPGITGTDIEVNLAIDNNKSDHQMRIMRILSMLIQKFYIELMTSGEIFISIFTKLLENDTNKQVSGPLKLARLSSADTGVAGTTISTVSTSEIPVVTTMISKLFENSHLLKREYLKKIAECLCDLSTSTYIIAKILELGIVNVHRVECIWDVIMTHFINLSKSSNPEFRDWGTCALTHLTKQTCSFMQQQQGQQQRDLDDDDDNDSGTAADEVKEMSQRKLLYPLQCLSQIAHPETRQRQLDVVLQVIQSATSDSTSSCGWPQIIDIVGTVDDWQTDNLIRIAFQCLQGIVSDYLSQLDSECVTLIIAAVVKFALQPHDLNVSLTAVGFLWNVADHLYQNKDKISIELPSFVNERDAPNLAFIYEFVRQPDVNHYNSIWMALFSKLSEICVDPRPAIRKSACQTLFATITTHGDALELATWQAVLWQILFPLLHQVRTRTCVALDMKPQTASAASIYESLGPGDDDSLNSGCDALVMHHSRNSAQKQWSETQVLALSGVTKVFIVKRERLVQIQNFKKAWNVLLEFIKTAALSKTFEVSIAALKCFQDLLSIEGSKTSRWSSSHDSQVTISSSSESVKHLERRDVSLWLSIWVEPVINLLPLCDESMSSELRSDFARCCFEALLQFSNLIQDPREEALASLDNKEESINSRIDSISVNSHITNANNNDGDVSIVNKLAVDNLLNRFMDVIIKYNHDERLAGKCPLPRHRMSEIVFVLRAMTTLLKSLKKVPTDVVGDRIWTQVLSLYPHLVDFATRNSPADQVKRESLNEVLLEYGSLLRPPTVDRIDEPGIYSEQSTGRIEDI